MVVTQTWGRDNDLRSVGLDGGNLLVRALGRGGDDGLVSPHGGQHGHGRPGVTRAGRHNGPPRPQQARLLRLVEDVLHDPVLHGEAGVEELTLAEHLHPGHLGTG